MKQQNSHLFSQKNALIFAVFVVFIAQALMTFRSTNQIRIEDLSESVRNVYFLQKRQLFDGVSSNVGWYGSILVLYSIFGFWIHTAKVLKLVLMLVSMISLARVLYRYVQLKHAWFPVLLYGLSPTFLYFNIVQTSFGVDLLMFPIVTLFFFLWLNEKQFGKKLFLLWFGWFLIMLVSMSYGTFLSYWPCFGVTFLLALFMQQLSIKQKLFELLIAAFGFFVPLIIAFLYMKDPGQLLYDPAVQSGIFRGGGMGQPITSIDVYFQHVRSSVFASFRDLCIEPHSYYYEVLRGDYSHPIARYVVIFLAGAAVVAAWLYKKSRAVILFGFALVLSSALVGGASDWLSGIRRLTPALAGFFLMNVGIWSVLPDLFRKRFFQRSFAFASIGALLFLLLFFVRVYPDNFARLLVKSKNRAESCFHLDGKNPTQTLDLYVNQVQHDQTIEVANDCRLFELYPAIAGSCEWNHKKCGEITFSVQRPFKKPAE